MIEDVKLLSPVIIMERWMRRIGIWHEILNNRITFLRNFAAFILLVTNLAQATMLGTSLHDQEGLFNCFSVLPFSLMAFLKLTSLRGNNGNWMSLIDLIKDIENRDRNDKHQEDERESEDDQNFTLVYMEKIRVISRALVILYLCTAMIFIASPFVEYALIPSRRFSSEYPHILPMWKPFDDRGIIYAIMIVIELIAATYTILIHIVFDICAIMIMIFVSGQFSKLRVNMKRIAGDGRSYCLSAKRDAAARYRIVKCYHHHTTLIRVNRILDSTLKPTMGAYINFATVVLCMTAVRLTSSNLSRVQLLTLMQYMIGNLTQLFLYCHNGDSVLQAQEHRITEHILKNDHRRRTILTGVLFFDDVVKAFDKSNIGPGEGVYDSAWWTLSPFVRKELLILGMGTSRPLKLNAGWFQSLNLPSYLSILQTTYSFYAVVSNNKMQ